MDLNDMLLTSDRNEANVCLCRKDAMILAWVL